MKQVRLIFILMLFMAASNTKLTAEISIRVQLEGLTYDTIWFGSTYGRMPIVKQIAIRQADGSFDFLLRSDTKPGFYAVFFKLSQMARLNYFHVAIGEGQGNFEVSCSLTDVYGSLRFKDNEESTRYYQYRNTISGHMSDYIKLIDIYRYKMNEEYYKFITSKEEAMVIHQAKFLAEHPTGLTADFARLTPMMAAPKSGDWVKDHALRWQLFTQQYLKNWQPDHPLFWSTPMGMDWLDHYVLTLWDERAGDPSGPVFEAMTKLKPYDEPFRYYLGYLLQLLPKSSRFDLDKVYVYLVKKYIEPAEKSTYGEEEWYRHTNQASQYNRMMTGNIFPDLKFYDENNKDRHVYDLDATYTLFVFWNPDCPHCAKELPALAKLYEEYRPYGLRVVTICGKRDDKVGMCWEGRDKMQLPQGWYYWADPKGTSRFQLIYNVYTIPSMYLVDQQHKILFRVRGDVYDEEMSWLLEKHIKNKKK